MIPDTIFVSERDRMVSVCAVLAVAPSTNATSVAVTVALSTKDITGSLNDNFSLSVDYGFLCFSAFAASDYVSVSENFIFPANSTDGTMRCLNVTIINDGVASEEDETFSVTLTTVDNIFLGGTTAIVTISKYFDIEKKRKRSSENAALTMHLIFPGFLGEGRSCTYPSFLMDVTPLGPEITISSKSLISLS